LHYFSSAGFIVNKTQIQACLRLLKLVIFRDHWCGVWLWVTPHTCELTIVRLLIPIKC